MTKIIGLSGYAGSGKDSAADALAAAGYERVAFADALRDVAYAIDPYVECRVGRGGDFPTPPQFERLQDIINANGWDYCKNNIPDVRRLLQRLGTEGGRDILGDNIWIDTAFSRATNDKIVVTDCRFTNETDAIRARGGVVVRIHRPGVGPRNDHTSELALVDYPFDYHIDNDGTLEELHEEIRRIFL